MNPIPISHARIRHHIAKARQERRDPAHKLGGPAPQLETFDPPIAKASPIAPDPKLRQKIQHGSPRKSR